MSQEETRLPLPLGERGKVPPSAWEILALLLIIALAAALRFYKLTEIPPGLHFDEGFKAVTARSLLEGAPPQLFFESDMGEEPLAIYLVAAAVRLFGSEPWVVRLPSAIVGVLTIPLAWWLGRELAPRARRLVGLGTALVLAILYWHVSFSRIGMEPILVPFFAALAFAALARGLNTGSRPAFVLSGLALGGSLYTYKAGYFVPILALLFVAYATLVERGFLRRHGRGLLLAGLVALLVAAPIGVYFATHLENFLQRPASVTLDSPGQGLLDNLPRVLGMFFVAGDANPRSNLPGRPALDPFLAGLFLLGVGRSLFRFRDPKGFLPVLWTGVMILPTLVTEHAPHFGRAIGATPALALLCALGGWTFWEIGKRVSGNREIGTWHFVVASILGVGLVFSGVSTARAYFHTWGGSPDLFYAYDVGLGEVAEYVTRLSADELVYLTPAAHDHFTLEYVLDRPWASFDGRAGLVFPPPDQAATVVVIVYEDEATLPALQAARPDGEVAWTLTDPYGRPYAVAYHLPASEAPAPPPEHTVTADFAGQIRLLGYDLARTTPHELRLTLHWLALAAMDADYTVFSHVLGAFNPATGGPLWAGHDGQPDGGRYPTSVWLPGEVILDVHTLTLPADTPPGEYQLEAGFYLLATLERLPATDAAGKPLPDNAVALGVLEIGE